MTIRHGTENIKLIYIIEGPLTFTFVAAVGLRNWWHNGCSSNHVIFLIMEDMIQDTKRCTSINILS